ncbi:hypothetical protein B0F90DRAFT_1920412 [Multifurca ochricompacta]|uniref:Uncharacterized protein n=1 Tax=Multifurca ochricompacta TaxID=376703 RepID=A0AAD4LXV5_9AGAM|nr:hypothetical protein B0F90DRAFT_1920412 [Multifurca ochricompacta]
MTGSSSIWRGGHIIPSMKISVTHSRAFLPQGLSIKPRGFPSSLNTVAILRRTLHASPVFGGNDALRARKLAVSAAIERMDTLENKLRIKQSRIEELRRVKSTDSEHVELKENLLTLTRQGADITQQYAGLVRVAIKDQVEATKFGLEYLQECSRKRELEALLGERDAERSYR